MKFRALLFAALFCCSTTVTRAGKPPAAKPPAARPNALKPVATAEEYLEMLKKPYGIMFSKLPPAEVQKVGAALRKQYPFKPVSKVLEYEEKAAAGLPQPALTAASQQRLLQREKLESTTMWNPHHPGESLRTSALKKLHAEKVADFVSRVGFGLSRLPAPSPTHLRLPPAPKIPLVSLPLSSGSTKSTVQLPATAEAAKAAGLQTPSVQDVERLNQYLPLYFATVARNGYIKDRNQVAGFEKHAFMYLPTVHQPAPVNQAAKGAPVEKVTWKVERMELISLLKHKQPLAYVTGNLPRMEDVEDAGTRGLNTFESDGLKQLVAGEDVVIQAHANRLTMIGSVRATQNCLKCHSVKRGQLLGAFSYDIVRSPRLNAVRKEAY